MMMITRTESHIEFGLGGSRSVSIDVGSITGAMLAAERLPSGRVHHALLLMTGVGSDPIRIEGELLELAEVHCYLVETMIDAGEAETAFASVH